MHATPRPGAMPGTLNPKAVKTGKPRGPYGLRQRRVRAKTFGEPRFECELVDEAICPTRPHVLTYEAHKRMVAAAKADGQDTEVLRIHSAYRSVAYGADRCQGLAHYGLIAFPGSLVRAAHYG